ncbi:hypothetical protein JOM56_013886 [Amanita muscaria]
MNVLSKFSAKITLVNKQQLGSYLQLGYNKCDNPYCAFKNSLQPVEGRYNCLGPVVTSANLKLFSSADPRSSGSTTSSDDDSSLQYCTGTYVVTKEQAHHVSHLFCVVETDHSKRVKRDKAAKKASRDARYRAEKLAEEVHKDLDGEYALRKAEAKERSKKDKLENRRNGGKSRDRKPQDPDDLPPVKRLRKEERRLPIIIRTGPLPTAVAEGSNATVGDDDDGDIPCSSSPFPLSPSTQANLGHLASSKPTPPPLFLCRRVRSGNAPQPSGIVWDDSVPALCGRSQSMRRAQYPPISSTRGRSRSGSIDTVAGRSPTNAPKPWVSSKNGVTITHFGTLLPAARCLSGRSDKENPVVSSSGKRYLISEPKPKAKLMR